MTKNMIQISMPILLTFLTTVVFLYFQNNKHSKESVGLFMYVQPIWARVQKYTAMCINLQNCTLILYCFWLLQILNNYL